MLGTARCETAVSPRRRERAEIMDQRQRLQRVELQRAGIGRHAVDAYPSMSKQALDSECIRDGIRDTLLGPAKLYEALRARGAAGEMGPI